MKENEYGGARDEIRKIIEGFRSQKAKIRDHLNEM